MKQKKRFISGETTPRSSFVVDAGFRYRFRVLNTGFQWCPLEFSIDGHNLTVISTDGNPVEAINVKSFYINPGERIDFVLNASQNASINYWIKVKGHGVCQESVLKIYQTAILKYNHHQNELPLEIINYDTSGPDFKGLVFLSYMDF